MASTQRLGAVFSDIDGTLVHYKDKLEHLGYVYVGKTDRMYGALPIHEFRFGDQAVEAVPVPSATLSGGFCSVKTIELVAALRAQGVLFCVLTGARTSTFIERRDSGALPSFDYGVCEGGGRLWNRKGQLDEAWLDRFSQTTGPWRQQLDMPCEDKVGPLWDVYRRLSEPDVLGPNTGKVKLDGRSFATAFMADVRGDSNKSLTLGMATVSDKEATLRRLVDTEFTPKYNVAMVVNLGKAHLAPVGLDKRTAVQHIAAMEGIALKSDVARTGERRFAAALFDDDNDLGFAELCDMGYAPTIAHPSVVPAMAAFGPSFVRAPQEGLLGTEFAIAELLKVAVSATAVGSRL
jgi:hydroxymethylpyrimidine pyrophosphatase-like HAD family hydrolase